MAKNPTRAAKPAPRRAKGGWRRFWQWTGIGILVVMLAGATALGVAYTQIKLPDPNADFQTNTSFVYYADGKEKLGSYSIQNRVTLAYEDIPQNVKDAMVAGENRSFWTDPGISIPGMLRAALSLVTKGDDLASGGSTITQQYIKVMYLTQDRTFTRKFTEILLAAKMGSEMSKEEILGGYLNTVYFGRGAYGIEAASQAFMDKPASKLTLAEAVALTAMVNNPGKLDPAQGEANAADLLERYQYTLNGLVEMGKITEAEKATVYGQLPTFPEVEKDSRFGGPTGFLLKMVESELKANGFSEDQINGGGLKIVSTFDAKAQEAAVKAATDITAQTVKFGKKKAKDLLESMQKEFVSPELKDTLNTSVLPPIDAIIANNKAQVASLKPTDRVLTLDVLPELHLIVSEQQRSEHDPHVTITADAEPGVIHVIINGLHPYYAGLDSTEALEECFRQYLYDAIAEYRVSKQLGRVNPDSVRRLKNDLLRAKVVQTENAAASSRDGGQDQETEAS